MGRFSRRDAGNALLLVMMMITVIMMGASALIEHAMVQSSERVEESLASTRYYWAMSGHADYVVSRMAQDVRKEHFDPDTGLVGAVIPTFGAFATDLGAFEFTSSIDLDDGVLCDASTVSDDIIRCYLEELDTVDGDNVRLWDYENSYQIFIKNDDGSVGEFKFSAVTPTGGLDAVVPVLRGMHNRMRPLFVEPDISSGADGNIATVKYTAYYRKH